MDTGAATLFLLAGWYLAVLVPTVVFKYVYLTALSGESSTGLGVLAASASPVPIWWFHGHDIVPGDFWDVLVIVAGLWLVGRVLLRIPLAALACASAFTILVLGGAQLIAIREVGAPLTLDNVRITRDWLADHPGLLRQFLTPRRLAWAAAALGWTATPVLFAAGCGYLHRRWRQTAHAVAAAMALVLVYSVGFGARSAFASTGGVLRRGFWTSVAASAFLAERTDPDRAPVRSRSDILAAYERIAFPRGQAKASFVADIPQSRRVPRHVVLVTLETAPLQYYPIADSASLPTFHAMSAHALVSTEHYASAPMTNLAMYSLITGTYPPPGSPIIRYRFKGDGLADVLLEHGYETSFIESYDLQWNGSNDERMLRQLGFATIRDAIQLAGPRHTEWDSYRIELESRAFDAALENIAGAASRGRKAFVCIETNLGHYDWLRPPHAEHMSAADRIAYTANTLDTLFGRFLGGLASKGLADDILIVVTGDHGLRFKMEFDSVLMPVTYADLVFNVPFIAYSRGIFGAQVRLPYPTSHADVAPTVLDLLGIPHDERLYLGNNMLDRRLADRIVFLPSASFAGLYPADAFRWKDQIYSLHRIVDRVSVRDAHRSAFVGVAARPTLPLSEDDARRIVDGARAVFEDTAAYFRRRFTEKPAGSVSRE